MEVLCSMVQGAVFFSPRLHQLCLFRMVNLSLEHGNCGSSCLAYAELSLVFGPRFKDPESGFRFCRTAFEIVERGLLVERKARVYVLLAYHVFPYTRNLREALALLRRTSDAARESGDLLFTTYTASHIISTRLALGHPLAEVEREANGFLALVRQMRFGLLIDCYAGQLSLIAALRGVSPQYESFVQRDEAGLEQHLAEDRARSIAACWYFVRKLQARVFANDVGGAVEAARQAQQLLWTTSSHFEMVEYRFYAALAHARAGDVSAVAPHREQLAAWARHSPETFANRLALVDAELARLDQRGYDAEREYERAIELSRQHGFVQHEGLASELPARFHAARGLATIAAGYLLNARRCYLRWGAAATVRALYEAQPSLGAGSCGAVPAPAPAEAPRGRALSGEQPDLPRVHRGAKRGAPAGGLAGRHLARSRAPLQRAAAGRALPEGGAAPQPHRQLRMDRVHRRADLVGGDLRDLRLREGRESPGRRVDRADPSRGPSEGARPHRARAARARRLRARVPDRHGGRLDQAPSGRRARPVRRSVRRRGHGRDRRQTSRRGPPPRRPGARARAVQRTAFARLAGLQRQHL